MTIQETLTQLDWKAIEASLGQRGYAETDPLLTAEECDALGRQELIVPDPNRHEALSGWPGGVRYFLYPLPPLVHMAPQQGEIVVFAMRNGVRTVCSGPRFTPASSSGCAVITV